jgi:hypothetical protein
MYRPAYNGDVIAFKMGRRSCSIRVLRVSPTRWKPVLL